jgi:hypothetical protein
MKQEPRQPNTGLYVRSRNGLKLPGRKVSQLVQKMYAAMHWLEPSDFPPCRASAELENFGRRSVCGAPHKGRAQC